MTPGDNIFLKLSDVLSSIRTCQVLDDFQSKLLPMHKKRFVIFIQPGAGAPVGDFIEDWKAKKLGGCTAELCEMVSSKYAMNFLVINTMTESEQTEANKGILKNNTVDVSSVKFIHDLNRAMLPLFGMNNFDYEEVHGRFAYKPKAYIFNAQGMLEQIINPLSTGMRLSPHEYMKQVTEALNEPRFFAYSRLGPPAPSAADIQQLQADIQQNNFSNMPQSKF